VSTNWWDHHPCNAGYRSADDKFVGEPHLMPFAEVDRWAGKQVLDAGCGIGAVAKRFARHGALVDAVDSSPESLKLAKKRCSKMSCWQVDLTALPPSFGNRFDLVWCWGVLHHCLEPQAVLHALHRTLRSGGTLKLMVYHRWSLRVLEMFLEHPVAGARAVVLGDEALHKFISNHSEGATGCPYTDLYEPEQLQRMVEAEGFAVQRCAVDHIFPFEIHAWRHSEQRLRLLRRALPRDLYQLLERRFGWHILLEATK